MSLRDNPLWTPQRTPTPFLLAQWRQREPAEPLQSRTAYLDAAWQATAVFRGLWRVAFPDREPLPSGPLADRRGVGLARFWDVFA